MHRSMITRSCLHNAVFRTFEHQSTKYPPSLRSPPFIIQRPSFTTTSPTFYNNTNVHNISPTTQPPLPPPPSSSSPPSPPPPHHHRSIPYLATPEEKINYQKFIQQQNSPIRKFRNFVLNHWLLLLAMGSLVWWTSSALIYLGEQFETSQLSAVEPIEHLRDQALEMARDAWDRSSNLQKSIAHLLKLEENAVSIIEVQWHRAYDTVGMNRIPNMLMPDLLSIASGSHLFNMRHFVYVKVPVVVRDGKTGHVKSEHVIWLGGNSFSFSTFFTKKTCTPTVYNVFVTRHNTDWNRYWSDSSSSTVEESEKVWIYRQDPLQFDIASSKNVLLSGLFGGGARNNKDNSDGGDETLRKKRATFRYMGIVDGEPQPDEEDMVLRTRLKLLAAYSLMEETVY